MDLAGVYTAGAETPSVLPARENATVWHEE